MTDANPATDDALNAFLSANESKFEPIAAVICPMCGAKNTAVNTECPACGESLASVNPLSSAGVWRDGKRLMMRKGATLPYRCLQTNEEAGTRLRKTFSWHPQWVFFLVISPLIYIIVALIVRQKATVELPLSTRVLQRRRKATFAGWMAGLCGIGLIFLSFWIGGVNSLLAFDVQLVVGFGGLVIVVLALIIAVSVNNRVMPDKITKTHVRLHGVHPDYLAALPEWREEM